MRLVHVSTLTATLFLPAKAHTIFTTLFIDGVGQGDGTCVRMPMEPSSCTWPIAGIESRDMACGRDGEAPVAFTCAAHANSTLTFEFREWADGSQPGSIDPSHKGPCAVYLKPVSNMTSTSAAAGPGWFKIWDDGYNAAAGRWCTESLIAAAGRLAVPLPAALPSGYYLVRPELLALQAAPADPQFYVGCAQLFVAGAADASVAVPAARTVSIPGHVRPGEPALVFDVHADPLALPYPLPGPPVYAPATAGAGGSSSSGRYAAPGGLVPPSCLLKVANWCGEEVAAYADQDGCWAASAACFAQERDCYARAPPTGGAGCAVWGTKCTGIQAACGAGDWAGPPAWEAGSG